MLNCLPKMRRVMSLLMLLGTALPTAAQNVFDRELSARRAEAKRLAGQPEAIAPLLGLLDLYPLVDDRAPIAALLDEVMTDRAQLGEVRAHATYLRAQIADRLGDRERARKLRDSLGIVRDWQVIGPFDNDGKSGHERAYPVERDLAAPLDGHSYNGLLGHTVSWRPYDEKLVDSGHGLISLAAVLRPENHVTGYATTLVHTGDEELAIGVGATGAVKVWLDGNLFIDQASYLAAGRHVPFDQILHRVRVKHGPHRLTVKLGAADGHWTFLLRIVHAPARGAGRGARLGDRELAVALRERAQKRQGIAVRAWGQYLFHLSPPSEDDETAQEQLERAFEIDPSSLAARLVAQATTDLNRRRGWLERAIGLAGNSEERARASAALAETYAEQQRDRLAEAKWREALAAQPDFLPAAVQLATLTSNHGLPAQALDQIERLIQGHDALVLHHAAAELADRLGRPEVAQRHNRSLHIGDALDAGALRALLWWARSQGDLEGALGLLDELDRVRPDRTATALERADLLEAAGRSAEAHPRLELALAICPNEPRLIERDGRILHRLGRDREALLRLRRALELRPQNPELRAYLERIESFSGSRATSVDLARAYAESVPELVRRAEPVSQSAPDPARVLLDRRVTRVHSNGLSETFHQRVVQILNERGARDQDGVAIRYTPDTQSVEVRAARVYKKSGEVTTAVTESERDLSEPWYGLYYDVKANEISFSHLEPGDVIDVEYTVSDVGRRNLLADYFGALEVLQEELPRAQSDYILITPRSRNFYFNRPQLPSMESSQETNGDETIYTFRARQVPKIAPEPGMPGFTDVAAYVHVSTYRTWEEVADWYTQLVRDALEPDDALIRAAAEATQGLTDERAKIRALYNLVVKKTHYVGLEFGIHGYQPYPVTQVLARKFGDCKDKASLLVALLRLVHVESTLALVRTRHGGDLDPYPASLAPFDHAIVYVPKYQLFLDGTAEFSGSDELPAQDQDVPVLLVVDPAHGGRGHLTRTPVIAQDRNRVVRSLRVELAPTGAARVDLTMSVAGEAAHEWRSHYQALGVRRERFEKAENENHPGASVTFVEFPTIDNLERPVEVRSRLEVPTWARFHPNSIGAPELAMPALGREGELLRSYARLSSRQHDLMLGYPWQQEERVAIVLPKGYTAKRLPEPRRIEGPFGSFAVTVERVAGEVALRGTLQLSRHRIGRAEYPEFRRFCREVDAAVGQELVIERE